MLSLSFRTPLWNSTKDGELPTILGILSFAALESLDSTLSRCGSNRGSFFIYRGSDDEPPTLGAAVFLRGLFAGVDFALFGRAQLPRNLPAPDLVFRFRLPHDVPHAYRKTLDTLKYFSERDCATGGYRICFDAE